ncbi:MAG: peroxidase [Bacteroidota bacterium]
MAITLDQKISSSSDAFEAIAADMQGNILSTHGRDYVMHLFLRFKDRDSARKFISEDVVPRIISAKQQKLDSQAFKDDASLKHKNFLTFSLSFQGYLFLGVPDLKTPGDRAFREGMKKRGDKLSDPKVNRWQREYRDDWHALMVVGNASLKVLNQYINGFRAALRNATEEIHVEKGEGIRNEAGAHIEHFGYVDGISQPAMLTDKVDSGQISREKWDPTVNLSMALTKDPGGETDDSCGSYLVFRKLEQNVKAFKEAERDLAEEIGVSVEYAGAQMMGRFRNGTPLVPMEPPSGLPTAKLNDFDYSTDMRSGSKCPFHSHVRKSNPRGSGGASSEADKRHLFPRRGITYGFTRGEQDPEDGVGLLFMAYNSDISNQFEFMQTSWCNAPGFPAGKSTGAPGVDPIIGQGTDPQGQNYFNKWGNDQSARRRGSISGFVKMLGGEYFYTPSISTLRSL